MTAPYKTDRTPVSPIVEVRDLYKVFPVKGSSKKLTAIDHINFEVREGETFGLIGESGSGKSTVGRCILNNERPTSGTVSFRGVAYDKVRKRAFTAIRRQMQMVFQDPYYSLNPRRTIGQAVDTAINLGRRATGRERATLVKRAFERVHLSFDLAESYPHQLSMGQLQRVGIARAIVSEPSFIVLDEPTSSLDITVRGEILDLLTSLQRDSGMTFLFISHDLTTVRYFCERVAVMYLANIMEVGSAEAIFNSPRHPYSKALLSSANVADPRARPSTYRLSGEIPSPLNIPRGCPLATRCPEVMPRCREARPKLAEVAPGHWTRCFLYHDESEPRLLDRS